MRKVNYKEKGITLIALVITIIILLILAGVTLTTALSQNGLFQRAKIAGENYKRAESDEAEKLDEYSSEIDKIINGEGTSSTEGKIKINEFSINGTDVTNVPIPDGFVHVGGTIKEGYVISDAHQDENKGADAENLEGNQFVWVPVKQNQKITLKVTSEEDITSIVVTNPFGDNIVTIADENVEKSYFNTQIEPTINGEYKVKVTTSTGETSKLLEVYSLYAQNFWITEELLLKKFGELAKAKDMTVEELIAEEFCGMSLEEAFAMLKSGYKTKYKETQDYEETVNTNGGFYIGRYEAGDSSKTSNDTEGSGELVTQKNKYVYNYISPTEALTKAQEYATSVETNATSSLLTGAAWDRTLGWLYETKNKTIEELTVDSKSWGNYLDNTFSETNGLIKTGQFPNTKANNIYDLAGNVDEWTNDFFEDGHSYHRGGNCSYNGSYGTACYRDGEIFERSLGTGFRLALY